MRPQGSRSSRTGAKAGECASSIPRFSTVSLTTKDFRWLQPEAWSDEHKAAFLDLCQAPRRGITVSSPYVHARRRVPPVHVGSWLLETAAEGVLGSVDAELWVTKFHALHVVVSRCCGAGGWTGRHLEALSLMISGLIIMTKADVVRVVALDPVTETQLVQADFGESRSLWTPAETGGLITPSSVRSVVIDPHVWWEREPGRTDLKTLSYLDKRNANDELRSQLSRRRKPGLLRMMSRLLRWS